MRSRANGLEREGEHSDNQNEMRTSFVYLIGAEAGGPVKIGHARDLRIRLNSLQVGCWEELKVLHCVTVPCVMAPHLEQALHTRFWEHRVRGEWFAVPLEVLRSSMDAEAALMVSERSKQDWFSTDACMALCKSPHKALGVISAYRHRATDAASRAFIKAVNAKLYEVAGQAAYVMFQMAFVEHRGMSARFTNQSRLARQAEASLVKALDALCDIWEPALAAWRNPIDVRPRNTA